MGKENKRAQGQQNGDLEREELHQIIDLLNDRGVSDMLTLAHIHLSVYPKDKDWNKSKA